LLNVDITDANLTHGMVKINVERLDAFDITSTGSRARTWLHYGDYLNSTNRHTDTADLFLDTIRSHPEQFILS
jgi:hypothetical protein